MQNNALGKGLSALISNDLSNTTKGYLPNVPIDKIIPNRFQPRIQIHDESLKELAESIKAMGVIEPLIVTRTKDKFELIAGERRLKAAKLAGLTTVPVVVREASPRQMLEMAVVENVQRADLNPLEEGLAFQQLAQRFKMSHTEIGKKLGLSRPTVANKIRLLKLPDVVKKGLLEGLLDEGHARALLALGDNKQIVEVYKIVIKKHLSVRAVEELIRRILQKEKGLKPTEKNRILLDEKTEKIESSLKKVITPNLKLSRSKRGGKIVIPFKNDAELEEIYKKLIK